MVAGVIGQVSANAPYRVGGDFKYKLEPVLIQGLLLVETTAQDAVLNYDRVTSGVVQVRTSFMSF